MTTHDYIGSLIDFSDESEICKVQAAGAQDIGDAVKAARNAFENEWRDTDATVRGDLLYKLASLVEEHADILASIETWDNGELLPRYDP